MMRIILCLFLCLLQGFCFNLSFKNFSSDFTQSVSSKNSKIDYKGHFIITPNQAFWKYESPNKKEIYINKEDIVIIEHDLEQVIFSKFDKVPNLSEIFKKAKQIDSKTYEVKYDNINYTIKLNKDSVENISYQDEFENNILIEFYNQNKDDFINSNVFTPKIPKHYDKVR
ncbi:LolA-like outer membrane lipoprotein chaperone [Campylobacter sp. LR264d]|uniref:LolA-like outer membrane lipoprotein chaperone n=1 Tax=Campylobacter sp. LR264d TaxID=2593544 RepID=UPI00398A27CF